MQFDKSGSSCRVPPNTRFAFYDGGLNIALPTLYAAHRCLIRDTGSTGKRICGKAAWLYHLRPCGHTCEGLWHIAHLDAAQN